MEDSKTKSRRFILTLSLGMFLFRAEPGRDMAVQAAAGGPGTQGRDGDSPDGDDCSAPARVTPSHRVIAYKLQVGKIG